MDYFDQVLLNAYNLVIWKKKFTHTFHFFKYLFKTSNENTKYT
jgi:hypothetical protein